MAETIETIYTRRVLSGVTFGLTLLTSIVYMLG